MQVPPNDLTALAEIRRELRGGANYMFVAPVVGKAIKSFDLSEFVSRFE